MVDLIAHKQLLVVPSGPLTSLPFHVLITEKPTPINAAAGYSDFDWLAKRHAVTVLPSVASVGALRRQTRQGPAPDPYLGVGNPLLTGTSGTDRRAWSYQSCAAVKAPAPATKIAGTQKPVAISDLFRGGTAHVAAVRGLAPLPETSQELCTVGRLLGGKDDAVLLGQNATETAVKQMSADGRLARARVVHFATHGLIAGDLKDLAQPALVLTPPPDGSPQTLEQDDGLLTAAEVAELKLNADWVVLSACNSAAGVAENAEALSGLANAFFYAGARALLVSHWPVASDAAVHLTTGTFKQLAQHPELSRAEALRQAMLTILSQGARQSHPAYWAAFVVVGEGAP